LEWGEGIERKDPLHSGPFATSTHELRANFAAEQSIYCVNNNGFTRASLARKNVKEAIEL
jgi:hypothetical protein